MIESIILFGKGDFHSSVSKLNAHFQNLFGNKLVFEEELDFELLGDLENFETFLEVLLQHYWQGSISPGKCYAELWKHYPTSWFPFMVVHFDFQTVGDYMSWEFDEAYDSLEMNLMVEILREGLNSGCVQTSSAHPNSLLPKVGKMFWEEVDRRILVDDWAKKIDESLPRRGYGNAEILQQSKCSFQFGAKYCLVHLFFNRRYSKDWLTGQVLSISKGNAYDRALFLTSIDHLIASKKKEKELCDLIFYYTAGRIMAEEPRAWMESFRRSIETGKVMFEM